MSLPRLAMFRGATMYEAQLGRVWVRVLRPKYWCRRNLPHLLRFGVERSEPGGAS